MVPASPLVDAEAPSPDASQDPAEEEEEPQQVMFSYRNMATMVALATILQVRDA